MDSLTATAQIEGLDTVLPLLEEARHEEALPLIEDKLAKQADVPLWKYLKALVVACQARGGESVALLTETSKLEGFKTGFGLPGDVNTLAKASALNHLLFETSVEPGAVEPWLHLEQVARLLGNSDFLTRAVLGRWKANPEDETAPKRFDQHFKEKSLDEKIQLLEEILETDQEACLPRACLGYYMQEKGKTALAIRHLKKALDSQPQAWQPHLYLGRVFSSQGRFEDAENRFSEAIALRKQGSAELLGEIAHCQKATYRYEEATETLFQALQKFPTEFSEWNQLFELAEATGAQDRLLQLVTKISQDQPDNLELATRIVGLALKANDPLEARRKAQSSGILKEPAKNPALAVLTSQVFHKLEQHEEATRLLESALKSIPESKELRTAYGAALLHCNRASEAEIVLKETALHHPNERELQVGWGRALLAIGDAERAHRAFAVASRLDPEDPEALAEQGRALIAMGQVDEALPVLKESAKKSDQPRLETLIALGTVYQAKGLNDIAKDFFKQALSRDGGESLAARGWLKTSLQEPGEVKESVLELLKEKGSDFERAQLYLNLLHSSLQEGAGEITRWLHQEVCDKAKASIDSAEYQSYLEKSIVHRLPKLAATLEQDGDFEKAREIWRFAVTSNDAEISQKATAELLRLDTVQAAVANSAEFEAKEEKASEAAAREAAEADSPVPLDAPVDLSGDDPLLSLLSSTLPVDQPAPPAAEPIAPAGAVPLFAPPTGRAPEPTTAQEEAPLFAEPVSEAEQEVSQSLSESPPLLEAPAEDSSAKVEPTEDSTDRQAELESSVADSESNIVVEAEAVLVPEAGTRSEAEAVLVPEAAIHTEAEPPSDEGQAEVAVALEAPAGHAPEPVAEQPATSPPPGSVETEPTAEISPHLDDSEAAVQQTTDSGPTTEEATSSIQAESSPRKELLPIPMAVDFEPLTRRQLHFHEALAQTQAGVLAPETIAHLMMCSTLGNEPPDPSSQNQDQDQQILALEEALLSSAQSLANQQQYRGASRLLKTALLYSPSSKKVSSALASVLMTWSSWLSESEEFAHAVSLLREASRKSPETAGLGEQLEATYRRWMSWSEEKGDPAAGHLLAVYLQQEQASLQAVRSAWKESQARRVATSKVEDSPPQPPKVEPEMPKVASSETTGVSTESSPTEPEVSPPVAQTSPAATDDVEAPVQDVTEPEDGSVSESSAKNLSADSQESPEPVVAQSSSKGFANHAEALAALDANPNDEAVSEAVFATFANSMRNLTMALRDKASANPDDPIWLLLLARAFRRSGSETMAVIQYQKYIKSAPSPEAYEELAMTYEEIGKEDFAKMTRRKAEKALSE